MEKTESFIFPARRAQWIVSSLAYHYGLDRGVENEIVVLAAGLDQYLQEIFHHLDSSANGQLPAQDFEILCEILGLANSDASSESNILLKDLPQKLDFKEFHVRLGEHFASQAKRDYTPVPQCTHDVEHLESEVRVRHPRNGLTVHTMCVECFSSKPITEIYKSLLHSRGKNNWEIEETVGGSKRQLQASDGHDSPQDGDTPVRDDDEVYKMDRLKQQLTGANEENESLREVIEDMRLALQSSDARSLALQVALRRSHLKHQKCEVKGKRFSTRSPITPSRSIDALIYELNHLRESRDMQLEEAMQFTQQLEIDLLKSRKELLDLEYGNKILISNQRAMTQELAKARTIVGESLAKVRELEDQSKLAEEKRQKMLADRQKMVLCSLMETKDGASMHQGCKPNSHTCHVATRSERTSPAGDSDTSGGDNQSESSTTSEEQLFRAVEGRAASDEENQWQENAENDDVFETTEVDVTIEKLQFQNEELMERLQIAEEARQTAEEEMEEMRGDLFQEIQLRIQDCEVLQYELQTLETERVRLSLVEETLVEIVALLRELRAMKMSRRSLGKIVMDTVEICHYGNRDIEPEHDVRNFVNCLHKQLIHCDLLQEVFAARRALSALRMEPCAETVDESTPSAETLEVRTETHSEKTPLPSDAQIPSEIPGQQTPSPSEVERMESNGEKPRIEPWMEVPNLESPTNSKSTSQATHKPDVVSSSEVTTKSTPCTIETPKLLPIAKETSKLTPQAKETPKLTASTMATPKLASGTKTTPKPTHSITETSKMIPWMETTKMEPRCTEKPRVQTYNSIDRETVC